MQVSRGRGRAGFHPARLCYADRLIRCLCNCAVLDVTTTVDKAAMEAVSLPPTASGDMLMSAAQRVLLISGSHNDPSARPNTGDAARLQAYNSLAQHYRIDSLQVQRIEQAA